MTRTNPTNSHQGFSLMQLLITVAVVGIVSSLAFLGISSARQRIRLTNSSRLLASYIEKARVDSVRRHPFTPDLMAGVEVLDKTTYRVKMDFDGNGTVETKDIKLDDGVIFATDPIALVFDWRGRLVDLPTTEVKVSIAMQWGNDKRDQRVVDVTRSGDVTIDSDVYLDDVPNVNLIVDGMTGIDSGSTLGANNTTPPPPTPVEPGDDTPEPPPDVIPDQPPPPDDNPPPIGDPNENPTPVPTPTPTPASNPSPGASPTDGSCSVSVMTSPSPFVFSKNKGGVVSFTVSPSGTVTFSSGPSNIEVTSVSGNTFTVQSVNNTRGNFTLVFNTPCGSRSVSLSIVN